MSIRKQAKISVETVDGAIYHRVQDLPKFEELQAEVKKIINESSYWETHGMDLLSIWSAVPLHFIALLLCRSDNILLFLLGAVILGCCFSTLANRAGHLAAHNALFQSETLNSIFQWLLIEVNGFFSVKVATDIHIKVHHPYTNIIGLGDSSSWKAPMLPRLIYMFAAPLVLPIISPIVSIKELSGDLSRVLQYLASLSCGFLINVYLLMAISGFTTVSGATAFLLFFRALPTIPYIHINIFQHIGLPMYILKDRPRKIYQMSTGVLNLTRNVILDWTMGHTLVYCHIEHHLFPKLSDNMVLKIRPIVKQFLEQNGLLYHEKTYTNRLLLFLEKYDELMVKAPPITHFVGL